MPSASTPDFLRRLASPRLLIALGVTAVISSLLWLLLDVLFVASIWPPLESPPRQGEAVLIASIESGQPVHTPEARTRTVREPQNTWSCLGFVFVAVLIVQGARDALGRWFGVTVGLAGLCAMFYHASATRELRHADIAGLYWACGLLTFLAILRLGVLDARAGQGKTAFLLWLGLGFLAFAATAARNVLIGGIKPLHVSVVTTVVAMSITSLLLIFCLRQADARKWRLGLGAIALMALGALLHAGDYPGGILGMPGAFIQPHAVWHLLCASSLGLVMQCFESPARTPAGRFATVRS